VLFVDEVHRFSKTQQDALLPAVENGWVTLVAATTENPSFSVIAPLLSRSLVVRLAGLSESDVEELLARAVSDPRGLRGDRVLTDEARSVIVRLAGGDARRALTILEAAAGAAVTLQIEADDVQRAVQIAMARGVDVPMPHWVAVAADRRGSAGSVVHQLPEARLTLARRLCIVACPKTRCLPGDEPRAGGCSVRSHGIMCRAPARR
jgi:putative ATPase